MLFVGSGVSKAAVPTLPTWVKLLEELRGRLAKKSDKTLVSALIRSGRLLDAAELLSSLILPADRRAILEATFRLNPTPFSPIYEDLLALDARICITTNYDQLIEKNFEHFSGGVASHHARTHTYENLLSDLRSPARIVLKLHGCISDTSNIVLDRRSFFTAKSKHSATYDTVSALSMVNTILFLGYSMNDPDIQLILEGVNAKTRTDHAHYALVQKFEHPSLREAYKSTYNINFLEYPKGRHEEFPIALKTLRETVDATRASSGIRV